MVAASALAVRRPHPALRRRIPARLPEIDPHEVTLGPRIGIGSYGEVYKGTWRGTEVAVKRFIEQQDRPVGEQSTCN